MKLLGTLLLQSALAGTLGGDSLAVVTPGDQRVTVAIARVGAPARAPLMSASALANALGGQASALPNARVAFRVGGVVLELADGLPFVRVGDDVHPLAVPAVLHEGQLYVPAQLAREVLPQVVPGVRWDATARALHAPPPSESGPTVASTAPGTPRREPPQRGTLVGNTGEVARDEGPTVLPTIRGRRPGTTGGTPTRATSSATSRPATRTSTPAPEGREAPVRRYTVVVDAGHGGVDNGMTGRLPGGQRVHEKNITLAISRVVARELEGRGHRVVMTRTRDTLIALADRGKIANQQKGDLFLSIHVNAANPRWTNASSARGFETYFLAEAKTEDARRVEQMENDAVRFETATDVAAGDPLSFIVTDMQQNEHLRESSDLAATVQRHLSRIHPGPNRGVKQAGFRVLVSAFMPAVLIEVGFGTNPAEAAWMSDSVEQARIARAIADAAEEYLAHFERRTNAQP